MLDRPSQLDLTDTGGWSSLGVFAPTLRHHDGRFWMITTNVTNTGRPTTSSSPRRTPPDRGQSPPSSTSPASTPTWPGTTTATAGSTSPAARTASPGAASTTPPARCSRDPVPTWSGTGLQYPEAPHLYERDGTWYLLIAEGGTHTGHAVSHRPGPLPHRPVGGLPGQPDPQPPQHRPADPEHRPRRPRRGPRRVVVDGAARGPPAGHERRLPRARPRDLPRPGRLGRRLAGGRALSSWRSTVGHRARREPIDPNGRDDFDGPALAPAVDRRAAPPGPSWCPCTDRPGWLTLHGGDATLDDDAPVLVGRRQQHHLCRARALVDLGSASEAGLDGRDGRDRPLRGRRPRRPDRGPRHDRPLRRRPRRGARARRAGRPPGRDRPAPPWVRHRRARVRAGRRHFTVARPRSTVATSRPR